VSGRLQYLLDTNILSETRKKQANKRVVSFLSAAEPSALFISVLSLGELRKGGALKIRSDADAAKRLGTWVDGLVQLWRAHSRCRCGGCEAMGRAIRSTLDAGRRHTPGRNCACTQTNAGHPEYQRCARSRSEAARSLAKVEDSFRDRSSGPIREDERRDKRPPLTEIGHKSVTARASADV
jgi:hypothetical protein